VGKRSLALVAALTAIFALPTGASAATGLYTIAGQITDATTGGGVAGICVYADVPGAAQSTGQTQSLSNGLYRVLVPAGDYLVHFIDCRQGPVYASQWHSGAYDRQHATPVQVRPLAASPAAVVNAALQRGTAVSGTVTDHVTGAPLSDRCVTAYGQNIGQPRSGWPTTATAADGTWTLVLVTGGKYLVDFADCETQTAYADQWWNGAPSMAYATLLTVKALPNQHITGVDAALDHGGTLTGRVTDDATGQPLGGICIGTTDEIAPGQTDATGTYAIDNVPPGPVKLSFFECGYHPSGSHYASEWYDHQPNKTVATTVTVTASTTTVVDESMLVGGSISGTVTDASTGQPLSGVSVGVHGGDTDSVGGAVTGADGTYTITGLYASDQYQVSFFYPHGSATGIDYNDQWWNGKPSLDEADYVSVRFGETTSGIDAAMEPR
jgi:hypothetical protein